MIGRKKKGSTCPVCGHGWHPVGQKCGRWQVKRSWPGPGEGGWGLGICGCTAEPSLPKLV
jgi:hypothetical protein